MTEYYDRIPSLIPLLGALHVRFHRSRPALRVATQALFGRGEGRELWSLVDGREAAAGVCEVRWGLGGAIEVLPSPGPKERTVCVHSDTVQIFKEKVW